MRRGRSSHDAEDLVQEAWVRLACYEREHEVEEPEALLMRTALNLSIDAHRSRKSRGEEVLLDDEVIVDTAPSIEDVLLSRERLGRLIAEAGWTLCNGGQDGTMEAAAMSAKRVRWLTRTMTTWFTVSIL